VVLSLCYSLEKNSSAVLGMDKDEWSERTGMGGGVRGLWTITGVYGPPTLAMISLSFPLCLQLFLSLLYSTWRKCFF